MIKFSMKYTNSLCVLIIANLSISCSRSNSSFNNRLYSEEKSDRFLTEKVIPNDIKSILIYYTPDQKSAYPIIEDYRKALPSLKIDSGNEINRFTQSWVDGLSPIETHVSNRILSKGTLHVIFVESNEVPMVYMITYLESGLTVSIFERDPAGIKNYNYLKYIEENYGTYLSKNHATK